MEGVSVPVSTRSVLYPSLGGSRAIAPWIVEFGENMHPDLYDYYMTFDYTIAEGFTGGELSLYINNESVTDKQNPDFALNGYLPLMGTKLITTELSGNSGSVEVRMNDTEWSFWLAQSHYNATFIYMKGKGFGYKKGVNYLLPVMSVFDGAGNVSTVNYLDYGKTYPTTEAGLEALSGYMTNFTITAREKTSDS